jgi:hypothetical protein
MSSGAIHTAAKSGLQPDSSSEKTLRPLQGKGSAAPAVFSKSIIYAWYSILPHAFEFRK